MRTFHRVLAALVTLTALAACGTPAQDSAPVPTTAPAPTVAPMPTAAPMPTDALMPKLTSGLSGTIVIDGSSTVFPITEIVAMQFGSVVPEVQITIGVSGTGGGFEKFCAGETAISNASRPIKAEEMAECEERGIDFIELPVAYDGISVVVNPENNWAQCMTTDELRLLWEPAAEGTVLRWNQIRADWPDEPVTLYGPGRDSGTYDYFTDALVGAEGLSRRDFTGSEDDYVLVQNVADNRSALGFFGYAYYVEHVETIRAVQIDAGRGCVAPSEATIVSGAYQPLSRPLFIYVRADAFDRPEVAEFVAFYLVNAARLVQEARYVPLPLAAYELAQARVAERKLGSVFSGGSQVGLSIEELLVLEGK